ncbi:MAG TPA: matrixin family metalloprotease [Pyrinomonadaceae bacterium]|nr:matrixin family metalloprotease [Pyrinomonadaceae bacterium]
MHITSAYTLQYTDASNAVRVKWPGKTIKIALSKSLNSPPSNIKQGSDVLGAVRRAMKRWSEAANITFIETSSDALNISPSGSGDGISLITVADTPENRAVFDSADRTGRTRIFYDTTTGAITEADVVINPAAQFSTDGTIGTYDLEATFTHELGHVLGLEHSHEAGACMQPRQGINGLYEQAATTARTLSDDDRAGARVLYGSPETFGAITGKVDSATGAPAASTHVWAEEVRTGKVVAGNSSLEDGSFRIEGLPPGEYRLVAESDSGYEGAGDMSSGVGLNAAAEVSKTESHVAETESQIKVMAGQSVRQDIALEHTGTTLKPQVFGTNGHLSTIAVPVSPGGRYTIFVGGSGLDRVAGSGITVTSPFIKVSAGSLTLQEGVNYEHPIISFDIEVAASAQPGDYSIRLESKSGEVAYISGGLTVDSPMEAAEASVNPEGSAAQATTIAITNGILGIFSSR